jgi:hypothetical protein
MVSHRHTPGQDRPEPSERLSDEDKRKIAAIQIQAADQRDRREREHPRLATAPRIEGRDYKPSWKIALEWLLLILMIGAVIFFLFYVYYTGVVLTIAAIITFFPQFLLAAFVVTISFLLWRHFRRPPLARDRLQSVQKLVAKHDYQLALIDLIPIAEEGHAPAQLLLAWMYEQGKGTTREPAHAFRWYEAAARRGVKEAQYAIGVRYAEGDGVKVDYARAVDWLGRAAGKGVAEAARRLGHLYETGGIGFPADREKAVEWYYRAGAQFLSRQELDDARALVEHLRALARGYPAVQGIVTKLDRMLGDAARPRQPL